MIILIVYLFSSSIKCGHSGTRRCRVTIWSPIKMSHIEFVYTH